MVVSLGQYEYISGCLVFYPAPGARVGVNWLRGRSVAVAVQKNTVFGIRLHVDKNRRALLRVISCVQSRGKGSTFSGQPFPLLAAGRFV